MNLNDSMYIFDVVKIFLVAGSMGILKFVHYYELLSEILNDQVVESQVR